MASGIAPPLDASPMELVNTENSSGEPAYKNEPGDEARALLMRSNSSRNRDH